MAHWLIKSQPYQTKLEEFFNALTHASGIGLSIAALVLMVIFSMAQHSVTKVVGCALFGGSLVIMYTASTLYHSMKVGRAKRAFKFIDHVSIYGVIAGTYTPTVLVILHGDWGWTLFGLVWGLALAGLLFKLLFLGRFEVLSVSIYVGMGWLAIIAIEPLYHALPLGGLLWLLAGGLSYTVGVIFYVMDRVRFAHSLWHLFVMGGSICHFFLVMRYVIPAPM
ncbi:MAG: hemolysin III family protein [Neisseriaceae bacterium]|nr:hemolysin III family protein [Neisseriaceae bacterium]